MLIRAAKNGDIMCLERAWTLVLARGVPNGGKITQFWKAIPTDHETVKLCKERILLLQRASIFGKICMQVSPRALRPGVSCTVTDITIRLNGSGSVNIFRSYIFILVLPCIMTTMYLKYGTSIKIIHIFALCTSI